MATVDASEVAVESTTEAAATTETTSTEAATAEMSTAKPSVKPSHKLSVINKDEIEDFVDLGLGRGVDSTNPAPWKNKTSIQIRHPTIQNLIGTEEGGSIQKYRSNVSSTTDLQVELKASVFIPNTPVSIGVDSELSRSTTQSKKIVGEKVINRTISFRLDIDDKPGLSDKKNFEEMISQWILNKLKDAGENIDEGSEKAPITKLKEFIKNGGKEKANMIFKYCEDFITLFGITHYVSAITLGGSRHSVMTEGEYAVAMKTGLTVSATSVASAEASVSAKTTTKTSSANSREIGKIINDKVARGTYDEAVIEIKVVPIHSLIYNSRLLYIGLVKAMEDYTINKQKDLTGPFFIQCGDDKMFWKVDPEDYSLTITDDKMDASCFRVVPYSDTDDSFDFNIRYQGKNLEDIRRERAGDVPEGELTKLTRYMEVKPNFWGSSLGPIKMKSELKMEDSQLVIYSQLIKKYFDAPSEITPWIERKEVFFISSASRKGYVAVCRKLIDENSFYFRCVSSTTYHDEKKIWMLFRLLPVEDEIETRFRRVSTQQSLKDEVEKMRQE